MKLVYGVGINDSSYNVYKIINRQRLRCPYYVRWEKMLSRCYSLKRLNLQPTYVGCSVVKEWRTFSNFKEWMEKQNWQDHQLDKDILIPGNKIYSPDACMFVPGFINKLLLDSAGSRGKFPIGVGLVGNKYVSSISIQGKRRDLGKYPSPMLAHLAWQEAKIVAISDAFESWLNPDPRAEKAIQRIISKIKENIDSGVETLSILK